MICRIRNLVVTLLFVKAAAGQEPAYRIASFETGPRTIPVAGNAVVTPLSGDELRAVYALPELGSEEMVLRRRFGPSQYGLYIGHREREGLQRLSAFSPPAPKGAKDFLDCKFYVRECLNPNMDMVDVYFDGNFIYAENATRLFYHDNGWKTIDMLIRRPCRLQVLSDPADADVYIDGRLYGRTPLALDGLFEPSLIVSVRKTGYRDQEAFINLPAGDRTTRRFTLEPATGGRSSAERFTRGDMNSLLEVYARIDELKDEIRGRAEAEKQALILWDEAYPPLRKQGEFEKTEVFRRRQQIYLDEKSYRRAEFVARSNGSLMNLESELFDLTAYKASLEARTYHRFLAPQRLEVGRYDAEKEVFPVSLSVAADEHRFMFDGSLWMPLSAAETFRKSAGSGRVKLSYHHTARVSDTGARKIAYVYTGLALVYDGDEYRLSGSYSFDKKGKSRDSTH